MKTARTRTGHGDTTVQTKAAARPTDSHLILRAVEWLNRLANALSNCTNPSWSRPRRGARSPVCYRRGPAGPALVERHARLARPADPRYPPKIAGTRCWKPRSPRCWSAPSASCPSSPATRTDFTPSTRQRLNIHCPQSMRRINKKRKGQGPRPLRVRLRDLHRHHKRALQGQPVRPRAIALLAIPMTAAALPDRCAGGRLTQTSVARAYVDRGCRGHGISVTASTSHLPHPGEELAHHPPGIATTKRSRAGHRPPEGRRPPRTRPPGRTWRQCDRRHPLRRRSQHGLLAR